MSQELNHSVVRIRREDRNRLDAACQRKGWKIVHAINRAIDALYRADPELKKLRAKADK